MRVYTATVTSDSYEITGILPGTYVITVTKADCAPLTAELTLEPGTVTFDATVYAYGDVTGDRKLNMGDVSKLYAYVRRTSELDAYVLLCADYNSDGNVNMGDVVKLYAYLQNC